MNDDCRLLLWASPKDDIGQLANLASIRRQEAHVRVSAARVGMTELEVITGGLYLDPDETPLLARTVSPERFADWDTLRGLEAEIRTLTGAWVSIVHRWLDDEAERLDLYRRMGNELMFDSGTT